MAVALVHHRDPGGDHGQQQDADEEAGHAARLPCPSSFSASRSTALRERTLASSSSAPARIAPPRAASAGTNTLASGRRSEEHTSELQSRENLVCRLLLE